MGIIIIVIGIISAAALMIILAVTQKIKAEDRKKYYRAAHRIIREQYLDGAIRNGDGAESYSARRLMVALKLKGSKGMGYVFDPSREIKIGRSMDDNDVCFQDLSVSSQHCIIFLYENQLCIKDSDSANGTVVKSPWRSRQSLFSDMTFLRNKSRIWVGNVCFIITIFYCEISSE